MTKKQANRKETRRPIAFSISQIELIESSMDIPENFEFKLGEKFTFKLSVDFSANKEKSLLTVRIGYIFYMEDVAILSMIVNNNYHIANLSTYIINKKFTDKFFIEYIADLSIDHARGIQSGLIKDTVLNGIFIPIVQLDNIANETIE